MQASADRNFSNYSNCRRRCLVLASKLSNISSLLFFVILIGHSPTRLSNYEVLCSSLTPVSPQRSSFIGGDLQDKPVGAIHHSNTERSLSRQPDQTPASSSSGEKVRKTRASVDFKLNSGGLDFVNKGSSRIPRQSYTDDQPLILEQCCACDEAKYELVFEGLWSRYTHPDDFPEDHNSTHFSDIIGASHSNEFTMWSENSCATEGVKELATTGSTKKLESELKQVSSKTRTIIKARELRYPTLNSKTSAVFRTDRQHHLVSILSKLAPSPDWMVGVSGLELCQSDCSWATQRVVNLYLWDAGADSGATFTAKNKPTRPQEKIHPYRKLTPNNNSSDPTLQQQQGHTDFRYVTDRQVTDSTQSTLLPGNEQLKPYARLTVTRQRIYEKSCNGDQSSIPVQKQPNTYNNLQHTTNGSDTNGWPEQIQPSYSDCRYNNWSDWSVCSSTCGRGIRTRTRGFMDENAQIVGCSQVDLIEKEVCLSECVGNTTCVTRDWSEWSKCSVDCGQGYRKRTRSPIQPWRRGICDSVDLAEVEPCIEAQIGNCTQDTSNCEVTAWSQWSECSNACGKGTRIRTRKYKRQESVKNCDATLIQKQSCTGRPDLCKQNSKDICTQPLDKGPCLAKITRWHYDTNSGMCVKFDYGGCLGSTNNFQTFQDCERNCRLKGQTGMGPGQVERNPNLPVIDCKLSAWSSWSTCSALCGVGKRTRARHIIQMPQNGGKPCDKLFKTQRCKNLPPCPPNTPVPSYIVPHLDDSTRVNQNGNATRGNELYTFNRHRATSTTTSSMFDDEDDSKFSRLLQSTKESIIEDETQPSSTEMKLIDPSWTYQKEAIPCEYGNWSQWSDCEVVCQPVKKGSNKLRHKLPIHGRDGNCQILEELYYCDPNIYC